MPHLAALGAVLEHESALAHAIQKGWLSRRRRQRTFR
jgi:hypothetical protein